MDAATPLDPEATASPDQPQRKLANLQRMIEGRIIGQHALIRNMLICLLCDGHILIEGMPGLAKTTAAKAMAQGVEGDFHRVQFTPDLLPADLIGTEIYVREKSDFTFRRGPIFNNILLADEINRAPAKVQSALLEAMEEKQVTVGHHTYKLPELYMVLATQNPIEQQGTYNLPEAQLDRFLMYTVVGYPSSEEELRILDYDDSRRRNIATAPPAIISTQEEVFAARKACTEIHVDERLKQYVVSLVGATRDPRVYDEKLAEWIRHGASPRATLALLRCAKALAWLEGGDYVSPHHIQTVAPDILRHRIMPSFEAEAENISRGAIVERLLEVVAVP
ncbi:MAG TPA: MoxR family ATPase [Rhizomicrobium sp.]